MDGPCTGMNDVSKDQLDRIEAKLDQVIALLTDEGAEDEEGESVEVVTMDGSRYHVPRNPTGTL